MAGGRTISSPVPGTAEIGGAWSVVRPPRAVIVAAAGTKAKNHAVARRIPAITRTGSSASPLFL